MRMVADHAAKAGASLWEHTEAAEPIMEGGCLRGARGAKGEDGHSGRVRHATSSWRTAPTPVSAGPRQPAQPSYPQGMALRGYWASPRHDEPWIDSWLDLRDEAGRAMPGYGWIFPSGDGRVNVGVGLLTTSAKWKGANTTADAGVVLQVRARVLGHQPCDVPGTGDRRTAAHGPVRRAPCWPDAPCSG